jgi:hypothetical protein
LAKPLGLTLIDYKEWEKISPVVRGNNARPPAPSQKPVKIIDSTFEIVGERILSSLYEDMVDVAKDSERINEHPDLPRQFETANFVYEFSIRKPRRVRSFGIFGVDGGQAMKAFCLALNPRPI